MRFFWSSFLGRLFLFKNLRQPSQALRSIKVDVENWSKIVRNIAGYHPQKSAIIRVLWTLFPNRVSLISVTWNQLPNRVSLICVTWTQLPDSVYISKIHQVSWTLFNNQSYHKVQTLPVSNLEWWLLSFSYVFTLEESTVYPLKFFQNNKASMFVKFWWSNCFG